MNELFERLADEINQLESWKETTTSDKHPFCAYETETVSRSKVLRILRNGLKDYEKESKLTKIKELLKDKEQEARRLADAYEKHSLAAFYNLADLQREQADAFRNILAIIEENEETLDDIIER